MDYLLSISNCQNLFLGFIFSFHDIIVHFIYHLFIFSISNYLFIFNIHKWKIKQFIKELKDLTTFIQNFKSIGISVDGLSKSNILNIGKIPIDQLQAYITEIQSIKNADYGDFGALQMQEYANALSDLDSTQTALLLKTQGLTNAQIQQTLAAQGASTAAQYQTMVEAGLLESSTMVCSLLPEKESNGYTRRFLVKLRKKLICI